jgi:hypothetical protein
MPRTTINWSNHKLNIIKDENVIIHELRQGELYEHRVRFTNTDGILVVTGDFWTWTFCRNFIPSISCQPVSDGYWIEKLELAHKTTERIGSAYSSDDTSDQIDAQIKELIYDLKFYLKKVGK